MKSLVQSNALIVVRRQALALLMVAAMVLGTPLFLVPVRTAAAEVTTYTVTFDSNGGSDVASAVVESGTAVAKPENPTRSGYQFNGWFKDSNLIYVWNFSTSITADRTLYADWIYIRSNGLPAASHRRPGRHRYFPVE